MKQEITITIDTEAGFGSVLGQVRQAISTKVTDADATSLDMLFVRHWTENTAYKAKELVRKDGIIYRANQNHTSQSDWPPETYPAGWKLMA